MTIMSAFMIVTITLLLVTSMLLYSRFSLSSHETIIQNTERHEADTGESGGLSRQYAPDFGCSELQCHCRV